MGPQIDTSLKQVVLLLCPNFGLVGNDKRFFPGRILSNRFSSTVCFQKVGDTVGGYVCLVRALRSRFACAVVG